jgi:hypothetical protein
MPTHPAASAGPAQTLANCITQALAPPVEAMTITFTPEAAAAGDITWSGVPPLGNGAVITIQGPASGFATIGGSAFVPSFTFTGSSGPPTLELKNITVAGSHQLAVDAAGAHLKLTDCTVGPSAVNIFRVAASNVALLTVKRTAFNGGEARAISAQLGATVLVERSSFSYYTDAGSSWVLEAASGASLTLRSSVVANNALYGTVGGAIKASGGASLILEASTLYQNWGGSYGLSGFGFMSSAGLLCTDASTTCTVHNSVVWDELDPFPVSRVSAVNSATATVTYSNIKGGGWAASPSNIEADPGFSKLIFPSYLPGVNLTDKGDPTKDPANPLDFAGNARFQGAAQDIGAFETPSGERCGVSGVGCGVGGGGWGVGVGGGGGGGVALKEGRTMAR